MGEFTELLAAAGRGDDGAVGRLIQATYPELRELARSRLRRQGRVTVLDTTGLVHECYLRLERSEGLALSSRPHFLGYAARTMRSIVVDFARERAAQRRGGDQLKVTLNTGLHESADADEDQVLRVNEALDELAGIDERLARVVEMRYFAGLTEEEIAAALGVTDRTVRRDWQKARLLLLASLS